MGDLTRAELRAEITANLGDKTNLGSGAGLDTLNRALDRAQTRIARANIAGWTELHRFSTDNMSLNGDVEVDAVYTAMPSNTDIIKALFVKMEGGTATTRLMQMLRSQWDTLIGDPTILPTASRILYYIDERGTTSDRELRWWPVPNVDYILYRVYTIKPTAFTSENQVSLFEDKDDLIIAAATHYMFNRFQAFEEAEQWRKNYRTALAEAITRDQSKPDVNAIMRGITAASGTGSSSSVWLDPFASGGLRRTK